MEARTHLLTVDDSEADGEIMEHMLAAAFPDADILRVAEAPLVETLCREQNFDCAILDYDMPEIDGMTLARRLRSTDAYLPIVLVTNVGDEMLVAEALRNGVSDYIAKSRITIDAIRRVVDRAIHSTEQTRIINEQRADLENFAYALAHDFKQPIRQVITFSKMLSEEVRSGETNSVQQHLNFLVHAATRLDRLVEMMLQYTLLNKPPQISDVDLGKVAQSVRSSLAPLLAERHGEFHCHDHGPHVRGNETMMIQVLQNLVVNGLHYNRSAVPRVEMTARLDGAQWTIDVSDNGIGIKGEYLSEIFKPLIRLHTAAEYAGSGLGLTLARKAILAQHGDIWCDSIPGRGSVFHIRLPAAEVRRQAQRKRRLAPAPPQLDSLAS